MDQIINFFGKIKDNIINNISNYLLGIGVISILVFLYMAFGIPVTLLGFGIFTIIASAIIELNKQKRNKNQVY
ncbi:hypothetical protein [Cetobacterium sp.]|uniref:hypothetical protein n=1 Tax=Cetobacterium sp. TaxID=2071632 RepID=UPI003EE58375